MQLSEHIQDLITEAEDNNTDIPRTIEIVDELFRASRALSSIMNSIPKGLSARLYYALCDDLEEAMANATYGVKCAEDAVKRKEQEQEDIENYGSYFDQVRSQYYSGR